MAGWNLIFQPAIGRCLARLGRVAGESIIQGRDRITWRERRVVWFSPWLGRVAPLGAAPDTLAILRSKRAIAGSIRAYFKVPALVQSIRANVAATPAIRLAHRRPGPSTSAHHRWAGCQN